MEVLHMPDMGLVATFSLLRREFDHEHDFHCIADWVWHPSSKGLIIADCMWELVDSTQLHAAGLAIGHCPLPAHLTEHTAFSRCHAMLLVPAEAGIGLDYKGCTQMAILQCTQQKQTYLLDIKHIIRGTDQDPDPDPPFAWWCPLQPVNDVLLVEVAGLTLMSASGEPLVSSSTDNISFRGAPLSRLFSPCGTLCTGIRITGPVMHMMDCRSGTVYKMPGHCDEHAAWHESRLFWPACGSCIVVQTLHHGSKQGVLRPFSLLQY